MPGDWIKMRCDLGRHPKVVTLSSRLNVTRCHVVGALHAIWSLADQHAVDGRIPFCDPEQLDQHAELAGFAAALVEIGWLEIGVNYVAFPNYVAHNGPTAKLRAQAQQRQKTSRSRHARVTPKCDKSVTREEKRRVYINITPLPPLKQLASMFAERWNAAAGVCQIRDVRLSAKRRKTLSARAAEPGWLDDYPQALAKFPLPCFCGEAPWRPNADWFLRPGKVQEILEGKYDWTKSEKPAVGSKELVEPMDLNLEDT